MERINQYDFYEMSKTFQRLTALKGGVTRYDAFMPIWAAQRTINALLEGRPIEPGVSRGKAQQFASAVQGIVDRHFKEKGPNGADQWRFPSKGGAEIIPDFEWGLVTDALSQFEMIFAEEMRERATYRVPDRGIYNTAKLVDAADTTFPLDMARLVPEKCKLEWRAAGRWPAPSG